MSDIFFDGRKFYLAGGYYRCPSGQGEQYLHRAVWSARNGPIPPGVHIHHKDEDRTNNSIDNLEAMLGADHNRMHALAAPHLRSPERLAMLDRVRPQSHEWHKTKEARAMLSEYAKRGLLKRYVCLNCGAECESRRPWAKYCSTRCGKAYRRLSAREGIAYG